MKRSKKFRYTEEQQAVIKTKERRLQVMAFAGSGKTATLVAKIEHDLERGADPAQILVLSFSNAAVRVLRERLPATIEARTFHSFGLQFIRDNYRAMGFSIMPTKLLDQSAAKLLTKAIKKTFKRMEQKVRRELIDLRNDHLMTGAGKKLMLNLFALSQASGIKLKTLIAQNEYSNSFVGHHKLLMQIQREFQKLKRADNVVDYGDMVARIRGRTVNANGIRYSHLYVDEYQDSALSQSQLLSLIGRHIPNVAVFGDEFQSIFGFAGGGYRDLKQLIPGTVDHRLTICHRLTQRTADLAAAIIDSDGKSKVSLKGARGEGDKPILTICRSSHDQTQAIIDRIKSLKARHKVSNSDILILTRTKAEIRVIEQALRFQGIETMRVKGERIAESEHPIFDVLKMVRALERFSEKAEQDSKVLNLPRQVVRRIGAKRNIPKSTVTNAQKCFRDAATSPSQSLEGRYMACKAIWLSLLGKDLDGKMERGLMEAELNRWTALTRNCKEVGLFLDQLEKKWKRSRVKTSTIHSVKGSESDYVILANLTEGALPLFKANTTQKIEEERNLFYVGVTRAKRQVFLFHAPYANAKSRLRFEKLSSFLSSSKVQRCMKRRKWQVQDLNARTINDK